jgi:hypothetical protein
MNLRLHLAVLSILGPYVVQPTNASTMLASSQSEMELIRLRATTRKSVAGQKRKCWRSRSCLLCPPPVNGHRSSRTRLKSTIKRDMRAFVRAEACNHCWTTPRREKGLCEKLAKCGGIAGCDGASSTDATSPSRATRSSDISDQRFAPRSHASRRVVGMRDIPTRRSANAQPPSSFHRTPGLYGNPQFTWLLSRSAQECLRI